MTSNEAFLWDQPMAANDPAPAPKKRGSIRKRADGREVEQLTIYLTPELAQRLRIAAVTERSDMSTIMAQALEARLA